MPQPQNEDPYKWKADIPPPRMQIKWYEITLKAIFALIVTGIGILVWLNWPTVPAVIFTIVNGLFVFLVAIQPMDDNEP